MTVNDLRQQGSGYGRSSWFQNHATTGPRPGSCLEPCISNEVGRYRVSSSTGLKNGGMLFSVDLASHTELTAET